MRPAWVACLVGCAAVAATACASRSVAVRQPEEARPHYVAPVLEIVFMDSLLNLAGRRLWDDGSFDITPRTIRRNARGPWVIDNDPIQINQIGHPYQGAMYHAIARSTGLGYWRSAAYTFGGSVLWEIAGETTRPSLNDQVASGLAGSFLGEALFRVANLAIDKSGNRPGFARSLLVLALSPPTSFNRTLFGRRFDTVFPTHSPAYDIRIQAGASQAWAPVDSATKDREGLIDASIEYGLPDDEAYRYTRPFDYFGLRASISTGNGIQSVTTRGLLAGRGYDAGAGGRGLWGVFGVYDYLSPQIYRVSSTAATLGTSLQLLRTRRLTLQATAHGGVGYAAIQARSTTDEHDYHYGLAPQIMMGLRAVAGDRVALDLSAQQYFVSGIDGSNAVDPPGRDRILRADAAVGLRLFRRNAVTVRFLLDRRVVSFPVAGMQTQSRATLGVYYTLLGPRHFGITSPAPLQGRPAAGGGR